MATNPKAPPTPTLVCKECGFENEPERVYCHSCGAKLDRSILPPEVSTRRDDPEEVRRRLKKMTNPNRGGGGRGIKNFLLSVGSAAVLAGLITAGLPPQDVPQLSQEQADSAPMISASLEDTAGRPAQRFAYQEAAVNGYLQGNVQAKKVNRSGGYGLDFQRAYVHFLDGNTVRLTQAQSLFGLPIYTTAAYAVSTRDGKPAAEVVGGGIGRLSLPAALMKPAAGFLFGPLFTATKGERKLLAERLSAVTCRKGQVEMVTRP